MDQTISRKVYVVDDDDAVRDSMRAVLESFGMQVRDYSSAQEFLVNLCHNPKGCLLLDLHMPGMSGVELLELLRMRGSTLPVIAVTGRNDPVLEERVMRAGALTLLDKPIDESMLMDALGRAFFFDIKPYQPWPGEPGNKKKWRRGHDIEICNPPGRHYFRGSHVRRDSAGTRQRAKRSSIRPDGLRRVPLGGENASAFAKRQRTGLRDRLSNFGYDGVSAAHVAADPSSLHAESATGQRAKG